MKVSELFEAKMKRSDPYISGELDGPRPVAQATPLEPEKKALLPKSRTLSWIKNVAQKANKSEDEISKIYYYHLDNIADDQVNRIQIARAKTNQKLGI